VSDIEKAFENRGWRLFQKQMIEWYTYEFKELSTEYKAEAIKYVIENNARIFTRAFVTSENLCHRCGICCKEIGCPDFNPETRLCTKHDNQNSPICGDYPWSDVGMTFDYNCGYQRDIFRKYMDLYFTKSIELMKNEGSDEKER